jgi:hypothetical protein
VKHWTDDHFHRPAQRRHSYTDRHWQSPDGLTLHYRDYQGPEGGIPVLCLPGLTRNARDFEGLAARLWAAGG